VYKYKFSLAHFVVAMWPTLVFKVVQLMAFCAKQFRSSFGFSATTAELICSLSKCNVGPNIVDRKVLLDPLR